MNKHLRSCLIFVLAAFAPTASKADLEDPYVFLKSLPKQWAETSLYDCKTYEDKNIELLSERFVVRAAAFLEAFSATHGYVSITSAYRNGEEQSCVCKGEKGPCAGKVRMVKKKKARRIRLVRIGGTSKHQLGLALDVRAGVGTKEEYECMHEFAKLNPQFEVHFPLGMRDRPHMEMRSAHVKRVLVSRSHALKPCTGLQRMMEPVDPHAPGPF